MGRFSKYSPDEKTAFWNKHKEMVLRILEEIRSEVYKGDGDIREDHNAYNTSGIGGPNYAFFISRYTCIAVQPSEDASRFRIIASDTAIDIYWRDWYTSNVTEEALVEALEKALEYTLRGR